MSTPETLDIDALEQRLMDRILKSKRDPLGFVKYAYPLQEGELADSPGPIRDFHITLPQYRYNLLGFVLLDLHVLLSSSVRFSRTSDGTKRAGQATSA